MKDKGLTLWQEGFHGLVWVHIEDRRGSWQGGLGDRAINWHRPLPLLPLTRTRPQACHSEAWDSASPFVREAIHVIEQRPMPGPGEACKPFTVEGKTRLGLSSLPALLCNLLWRKELRLGMPCCLVWFPALIVTNMNWGKLLNLLKPQEGVYEKNVRCSVMSNSLGLYGLYPTRLLP